MNLQADLIVLLPELIVAVGAMALLLGGVIAGDRATGLVSWLAVALMAAAGVHRLHACRQRAPPSTAPSSSTASRASPNS